MKPNFFLTYTKHFISIFLACSAVAVWIGAHGNDLSYDAAEAQRLMKSITPDELKFHIDTLASEIFVGRAVGNEGEVKAANYLAAQFERMNLQKAGKNISFLQKFQTLKRSESNASIEVMFERGNFSFGGGEDFVILSPLGNGKLIAEIVFAGYGITAPEYEYDDYANIDVGQKIVLIMLYEPGRESQSGYFKGTEMTRHGLLAAKVELARQKGASAVLLITEPTGKKAVTQLRDPYIDGRSRWVLAHSPEKPIFPVVGINADIVETLFSGGYQALDSLQDKIEETRRPLSFPIPDLKIKIEMQISGEPLSAQNVVAILPGDSSTLRQEAVVIGAHFDHLGKVGERINPGADDNASGVAGLLEIAEAFSESSIRPRRSLLFVAFSAEELGLLGSEYFVQNSPIPLEKINAMINLDMIGRNHPNEVSLIGAAASSKLHEMSLRANARLGLNIKYNGEQYFYRSDQANFARRNIPIIFYNTAIHEDYHRFTDTADKIDHGKVSKISRLAFLVAWQAANADLRSSQFERTSE